MTARDATLVLLRDFGVRSLDPADEASNLNGRPISTGDMTAILGYMTGALQEAWADGPVFLSQRDFGGVLMPPATFNVTVTQYSRAYTTAGYLPWMIGCTIRVGDDAFDNEILSATELVRPYLGSAGVQSATVWSDCMPLETSPEVSHLISPVMLAGSSNLTLVGTRTDLLGLSGIDYYRDANGIISGAGSSTTANKRTGTPRWGFVDTIAGKTGGSVLKYLRVSPMPESAYALTYRGKIVPPVFTAADVDNGDHTTDPGIALPIDWHQSVFIPLARQRASGDPLFLNDQGRGEIARQFALARAILKTEVPGISTTMGSYN